MKTDTTELENDLKQFLIGKKLKKLSLMQVNQGDVSLEKNEKWLIDGGVQLDFGKDIFSFGWDSELELFRSCNAGLDYLTGNLELKTFDERNINSFLVLRGLEVTNISLKWSFYVGLDDNFQPLKERTYILKEIVFTFANVHRLQISPVSFDYNHGDPKGFIYDSESEMLVLLNANHEIAEPDMFI